MCCAASQEWASAKPYKCRNCDKQFGKECGLEAHFSTCGKSMAVLEQVCNGFDAAASLWIACVLRCVAGVGLGQAVQVLELRKAVRRTVQAGGALVDVWEVDGRA